METVAAVAEAVHVVAVVVMAAMVAHAGPPDLQAEAVHAPDNPGNNLKADKNYGYNKNPGKYF